MPALPVIGVTAWKLPFDTLIQKQEPLFSVSSGYVEALSAAGAVAIILTGGGPDEASEIVARIDGLVVSGGGDIDPAIYGDDNTSSHGIDDDRDQWEISLVRAAQRAGLPTLGICRGIQILNVALGGTLLQDVWKEGTDHPSLWDAEAGIIRTDTHPIEIEAGSRLESIYGTRRRLVNSLHHQAIDQVGEGLRVTARSPGGVVEGIEATTGWRALGVQWHPERSDAHEEAPLFAATVADARTGSADATAAR